MGAELSRRDFVVAASAAAVASASIAAVAMADEAEDLAAQVTETIEADVCVVGSGVSGMAAAVQAAELGLKVTVLEASAMRGGTIRSTEGLCAVGSPLQVEQGIEISIPAVIKAEASLANYKMNCLFWKEMLERSGDNIAWLIENGVEFTGQVDDYRGDGEFPTFHWFPGDHEAQTYYGDPLEQALLSNEGCQIIYEARGMQLKLDGDKVAGVYAKTAEGAIEVAAPAVILATGGFAGSVDEVVKRYPGLGNGRYTCDAITTNAGDGARMAMSAGGFESPYTAVFNGLVKSDTPNRDLGLKAIDTTTMWVNQDAVRVIDETVAGGIMSTPGINLMFQHEEVYSIFDADMFGELLETVREEAVESPTGIFVADTIEDLAAAISVDPAALAASVERYNAMVDAGVDDDFGRDMTGTAKIVTAPFVAFRQVLIAHGNIGGTQVNLKYEVVRPDNTPVAGLYAVGTESNMNYREFAYSLKVPGAAMCQAVDSGRWAAKNAAEYLA